MSAVDPFSLDVLPPHSSVAAQVVRTEDGLHVRFQAEDSTGRYSEWSGWFIYDGEPIGLTWAAFGWDGEPPPVRRRRRWWRRASPSR